MGIVSITSTTKRRKSVDRKPKIVTEDHLEYLDDLRESGVVNMFGAAPYVRREFGLSEKDAGDTLQYWMDTFSNRHN